MSALTGSAEQSIRHALEELWPDFCLRGNWDGCLGLVSDDFVYMTPDVPAFKGKAEVGSYLEGFPPISHMTQSMEVLTGSTELAVAQCTWELGLDVEGTKMAGTGKSLITATQRNGDWVFTSCCFNFDAPMAASE